MAHRNLPSFMNVVDRFIIKNVTILYKYRKHGEINESSSMEQMVCILIKNISYTNRISFELLQHSMKLME